MCSFLCVPARLAAAVVSLLAASPVLAQTIISGPGGQPIPVAHPLALLPLAVVMAILGVRVLRGRAVGHLSVLAALLAVALAWNVGGDLRAQILSQFTNPAGETLPIPIEPIVVDDNLQGFEPADFSNAAGRSLRIVAVNLPDLDDCFPGGVPGSLTPLDPSPGVACAQGSVLADGQSCRVDVDTVCKNLAADVPSPPLISITGPVQQSRVVVVSGPALSLQITNDAGSAVNATNITVTDHAAFPALAVDDSACVSLAPGASCTLLLSSSAPYAPGTVTIGGSNTGNSPATLLAFGHLGGLVFEESGGAGKVVVDQVQEFTSAWTSIFVDIVGADSLDDGLANTNAIVVDASCSGDQASCAAQRCRNIAAEWYLPARNELEQIQNALCENAAIPCNFGGFASAFYRSSSQSDVFSAWDIGFPSGLQFFSSKDNVNSVRCARVFTP